MRRRASGAAFDYRSARSGDMLACVIAFYRAGEIFMNGRSPTIRTAAALAGVMLSATVASAAELKVFTSVALTTALDELAPIFERKTGNKLTISYDLAAVQKKRILEGERADVIILTRAMMDDLAGQNKLAPGIVNVANTPVAL